MPIRFSTEAANADHMGSDPETGGVSGTPIDPASRTFQRGPRGSAGAGEPDKSVAGKPGKDINAPGFIKDKDAGKP